MRGGKIVGSDHVEALGRQVMGKIGPDEAGGSGD
jgi:hypothetical protein